LIEVNKIIKDIKSDNNELKILDMGCGSGEFIEYLRNNTGCSCYGVDLSQERVEISQSTFPNVSFSVGSLESISYQKDKFDIIISTQTIEHLFDEDLKPTFDEMNRLLKTNGRLLLTTRFEEDLNVRKRVCPDCHAIFLHSQHLQSFSELRLETLLTDHGLKTVDTGRSRCRNHVNEFVPRRYKFINWLIYKIFGSYLDIRIGKYLYLVSVKRKNN
jgi:cyclopropane fatty-acyl-phospholipid synthase-like methyltransferase